MVARESFGTGSGTKEAWGEPKAIKDMTKSGVPPKKGFKLQGDIKLHRLENSREPGVLMGTVTRSPITGEIKIKIKNDKNDFTVVDLFARNNIVGNVEDLMQDKYLFRPEPLPYRTWMYHHSYRNRTLLEDDDESAAIRAVLRERCIDRSGGAGRWSPLMCFAPAGIFACFTPNLLIAFITWLILAVLYTATASLSVPSVYRYVRLITLPIRLAYLFYLLAMTAASGAEYVGGILAIVVLIFDLIAGDLSTLVNYNLTCSYEIVRPLRHQVYVCRRKGAASLGMMRQGFHNIGEEVSGVALWASDLVLIADIMGILVELIPMREKDWFKLHQEFHYKHIERSFVGLDVYTFLEPTAKHLDATDEEKVMNATRNASPTSAEGSPSPPLPALPGENEEVTLETL